jgi:hypothetical protein
LRPQPALLQGATGTMIGPVAFRNVSSRRCEVGGRPRVTFVLGTRVLRTRPRALGPSVSGPPVRTIRAGGRAAVYLEWSNWCGAWPVHGLVHTIRVRLLLTTGVRLTARVRTGRARCDAPSAPSRLYVSAFGAAQ